METNHAIRQMISNADLTPYGTSLKLGKTHSYITSLLKRKGGVSAPVLATIANVCDYDLVLIPRNGGDSIPIDYATKQDATD